MVPMCVELALLKSRQGADPGPPLLAKKGPAVSLVVSLASRIAFRLWIKAGIKVVNAFSHLGGVPLIRASCQVTKPVASSHTSAIWLKPCLCSSRCAIVEHLTSLGST